MAHADTLLEKIRALPEHRLSEVEDFIEALRSRDHDRSNSTTAARASEPVFASVWDNPVDAVYDSVERGDDLAAVLARLHAVSERIGPLPGPSSTERLRWDRDRDDRALFEPDA